MVETRFIAEPSDVICVTIECQCGASLSFNPDKSVNIPERCAQCDVRWGDSVHKTADWQSIRAFAQAIRMVREQSLNNMVKIKMEFRTAKDGSA
jgi:hypothetical protein